MTFKEITVSRVRDAMKHRSGLAQREMFGGIAFMLDGNMCCGVINDNLVVRVGPDAYEGALREPHVRPMDFTGRPLPGFIFVDRAGFADDDTSLRRWIERGIAFVQTLPPKYYPLAWQAWQPLAVTASSR